jgi:periplasmic protein TonB
MRKIIFFILLLVFQFVHSQEQKTTVTQDNQTEDVIYDSKEVDVKPEFKGGISFFYKYVGKNFNPPDEKNFKGGKIVLTFVIEKDGSITNIDIEEDAGFNSRKEAIKLMENSPKWIAGEKNGKKVRCSYTFPITLNISD